jgi:hypothetical protein
MNKSLKRAIQRDFDGALANHLPADSLPHDMALEAIGFASLGEMEASFETPAGNKTVAEIIKEYGLLPFVEMAKKCSEDAEKQDGISAGEVIVFDGKVCWALMRRKARASGYELLLKGRNGEEVGLVSEGEVRD